MPGAACLERRTAPSCDQGGRLLRRLFLVVVAVRLDVGAAVLRRLAARLRRIVVAARDGILRAAAQEERRERGEEDSADADGFHSSLRASLCPKRLGPGTP